MPRSGKPHLDKKSKIEILSRFNFKCYSCGKVIHGFDQIGSGNGRTEEEVMDTIIEHAVFQRIKSKKKGGLDHKDNIVLLCDSGVPGGSSPDTKKCSGRTKIWISNWLANHIDMLVEERTLLATKFEENRADGKVTFNLSRDQFIEEAIDFFFDKSIWWHIHEIDDPILESIVEYAFQEKYDEIEDLFRESIVSILDDEALMGKHFHWFANHDAWNVDSKQSLLEQALDKYTSWKPEIQKMGMLGDFGPNRREVKSFMNRYYAKEALESPEIKEKLDEMKEEMLEGLRKIGLDPVKLMEYSRSKTPEWMKERYDQQKDMLKTEQNMVFLYEEINNALIAELKKIGYESQQISEIVQSSLR